MTELKTIEDQARYILMTGRMIQDKLLKFHSQQLAAENDDTLKDLTVSQLHVILLTRNHGELTMSELAGHLGVSPPSASAMVDRLVEKNLLCREHSSEDRRKVVVFISPEGAAKADKMEKRILGLFMDLVKNIGAETTRKWCEVLDKVQSVLLKTY